MYLIGKKLKALRRELDLTQEDFAEDIGATPSHISLMENDKRGVTIDSLKRICKAYKKKFEDFL